jgi:hypothetical protein
MDEHEQNLRDLAAMFAMAGFIARNKQADPTSTAKSSYIFADELMAERKGDHAEEGIAAIKKRRTRSTPD